MNMPIAGRKAAFAVFVAYPGSNELVCLGGLRLRPVRQRLVKPVTVIVDVYLAAEKNRNGLPDIFVAKRPGIDVKLRLAWILRHFLQQLVDTFCFGRKMSVAVAFICKCGI